MLYFIRLLVLIDTKIKKTTTMHLSLIEPLSTRRDYGGERLITMQIGKFSVLTEAIRPRETLFGMLLIRMACILLLPNAGPLWMLLHPKMYKS